MSFYLFFVCSVIACASAGKVLKWPEQYTCSGSIYLPYATINEPFTAVVDMGKKRSMMSTYAGIVHKAVKDVVADYLLNLMAS